MRRAGMMVGWVFVWIFVWFVTSAHGEAVRFAFGEEGLAEVVVGGRNLLGDATVKVTRVVTTPAFRDRHAEPLGPYPSPTYAGESRTFSDASVEVLYHRTFDQEGRSSPARGIPTS